MDERTAILLVSASEKDANMYYATRMLVPDAFIYLQTPEERIMVIGNLELERARATASVDRVLPLVQYWKQAQDKYKIVPTTGEIVDVLLQELNIQKVVVPPDFSLKFADSIRSYGYQVEVKPEPFFEERTIKTDLEVKAITETIRATEEAMRHAFELLRQANISSSGILMLEGEPLTSEIVRRAMNAVLGERSCSATHTVVSCGRMSALPHEEGSGPLYANEPIVIDCSPKSLITHYFADVTRTVVRGQASEPLKKQYQAVSDAQDFARTLLKPGANGKEVHAAVAAFLNDLGYKTHSVDGKPQGFFHATGHGFGIEGHERPHLALRDHMLSAGNVLAIEPALYYSEVGGVRVEDDILIQDDNIRVLTEIERELEL